MKLSNWLVLAMVCLATAQVGMAADTSKFAALQRRFAQLPPPELPPLAAELVKSAVIPERTNTMAEVLTAVLSISPDVASSACAALAKAVPDMAGIVAATAARLQPKQAAALAAATAAAAPAQAGNIVVAVCREVPYQYRQVCLSVADVVPKKTRDILLALAMAFPELKPRLEPALQAGDAAPNLSSMLASFPSGAAAVTVAPAAAATAPGSLLVGSPLAPATPAAPPTAALGPIAAPPSAGPNHGTPSGSGTMSRGGRDYASP